MKKLTMILSGIAATFIAPLCASETIHLSPDTNRHHLNITTDENVYIHTTRDTILEGHVTTDGHIYIIDDSGESTQNRLELASTFSINGYRAPAPESLYIKGFGDTYLNTSIEVDTQINIQAKSQSHIEVNRDITAGIFSLRLDAETSSTETNSNGLYVSGGTNMMVGAMIASLANSHLYISSGASIYTSSNFYVQTEGNIAIESPIKSSNTISLQGGEHSSIGIQGIEVLVGSYSVSFSAPHVSIRGNTVNLLGDINTDIHSVGISADTINLYSKTITADPIRGSIYISDFIIGSQKTFNAYGGKLSAKSVCVNSENVNDYGLSIESTYGCN